MATILSFTQIYAPSCFHSASTGAIDYKGYAAYARHNYNICKTLKV